jgi:hypothetical protein
MRPNKEELTEVACMLRGTQRTLANALAELNLEWEQYDLDEVLDLLAETEDTQRCAECRTWALIALCPNCEEGIDDVGADYPDESNPDDSPGLDLGEE